MRRVLWSFVLLSVGGALGWTLSSLSPVSLSEAQVGGQGGGEARCAAKNGDVNADGNLDVSDAVTILGHLFLGSPTELLALCAVPPAGLPDTGQRNCYGLVDDQGKEIGCDSATCPGQDGSYATGCPSEGRFVDNGDGTVTDHCTGLMWQKDTADVNGDGQFVNNNRDDASWCDALAYCENLSFAGHNDWRLPNVRELQGIVDYGRINPSIDPAFDALSSVYWSSTSYADNPDSAWVVYFGYGAVSYDGKAGSFYVLAVRSGT
jgi:hypothetical protein